MPDERTDTGTDSGTDSGTDTGTGTGMGTGSGADSGACPGAAVTAPHAANGTSLARAHGTYCALVVVCLERRDLGLLHHLTEHRTPRAFLGWFDRADEARLSWTESGSWHVTTGAATFHAPLDPLADPDSVAAWAAEALAGRLSPATGPARTWRSPTDPDAATREHHLFEQRLAHFATDPLYAWAREALPPAP